jgi:hypothetical protein
MVADYLGARTNSSSSDRAVIFHPRFPPTEQVSGEVASGAFGRKRPVKINLILILKLCQWSLSRDTESRKFLFPRKVQRSDFDGGVFDGATIFEAAPTSDD